MEKINKEKARSIWINSTGLNLTKSKHQKSLLDVIKNIGYVQIDTISVIERCHHHILYNRYEGYEKSQLQVEQSKTKNIFEYWTHALAYIPTDDYRYYINEMKKFKQNPSQWFSSVTDSEYKKVFDLIKKQGPIAITEIKDDVLVEKKHLWSSKKPSKKAMQLGFYNGELTISERVGMLKKYDITKRHFAWKSPPKAATETETTNYLIDRTLSAQGFVSVDSICHNNAKAKPQVRLEIQKRIKNKTLLDLKVENGNAGYFIEPESLKLDTKINSESCHILSPFDPLIIQRKRLENIFDIKYIFEAYVPKEKRIYGYFSLPVLIGSEIVALLDLKTDRQNKKLLVQNWIWLVKKNKTFYKKIIENELHRFEEFQLR